MNDVYFLLISLNLSDSIPESISLKPLLCALVNTTPGLGNFLNGKSEEAGWDLIRVLLPLTMGIGGFIYYDDDDGDLDDVPSKKAFVCLGTGLLISQEMYFYSIFSAYKTALLEEKISYKWTKNSFWNLYFSAFGKNLSNLKVILPLMFFLGGGIALSICLSDAPKPSPIFGKDEVRVWGMGLSPEYALLLNSLYYGFLFSNVALAEESLFRGFLQTEIARLSDSEIFALISQALIFGLLHARSENPLHCLIRISWATLAGLYMGWLYKSSGYDLAPSITFHFLYDTLLSVIMYVLYPDLSPLTFGIKYSF